MISFIICRKRPVGRRITSCDGVLVARKASVTSWTSIEAQRDSHPSRQVSRWLDSVRHRRCCSIWFASIAFTLSAAPRRRLYCNFNLTGSQLSLHKNSKHKIEMKKRLRVHSCLRQRRLDEVELGKRRNRIREVGGE
jgi:hypothetical protein